MLSWKIWWEKTQVLKWMTFLIQLSVSIFFCLQQQFFFKVKTTKRFFFIHSWLFSALLMIFFSYDDDDTFLDVQTFSDNFWAFFVLQKCSVENKKTTTIVWTTKAFYKIRCILAKSLSQLVVRILLNVITRIHVKKVVNVVMKIPQQSWKLHKIVCLAILSRERKNFRGNLQEDLSDVTQWKQEKSSNKFSS